MGRFHIFIGLDEIVLSELGFLHDKCSGCTFGHVRTKYYFYDDKFRVRIDTVKI